MQKVQRQFLNEIRETQMKFIKRIIRATLFYSGEIRNQKHKKR